MYSLEEDFGRVTAMQIGIYDEISKKVNQKYIPQIEFVKYDPATGEEVSSRFVCVGADEPYKFDNEIKAIQYAMECREEYKKSKEEK